MNDNDLKAFRWATGLALLALLAVLGTALHCDGRAAPERDTCLEKLKVCKELCK